MEANRIESTARGTLEHSLNSKWQQTNPVDNNSLPSESRSKSRRFSGLLNLRVGWKSKFWRFRASRGVWVGASGIEYGQVILQLPIATSAHE